MAQRQVDGSGPETAEAERAPKGEREAGDRGATAGVAAARIAAAGAGAGAPKPPRMSPHAVAVLQRRVGNRAVGSMLGRPSGGALELQREPDVLDAPPTELTSTRSTDTGAPAGAPPAPPGGDGAAPPAPPPGDGGSAAPAAPAAPPAPPPAASRPPAPPPAPPRPEPAAPRREGAGGPPAGERGAPDPTVTVEVPATTTSSPVPAPPAPATVPRAPGTNVPAPRTADPDVDWAEVAAILIPPGRTVLEVMRFIPGWGGVAGMASDVAGAYSDLTSVPQNETGELVSDLVLTRSVITVANGALGHLLYVNQLVQDGLAGSIVGAEFTPFTAAINETLSTVKIFLDVGNGMVDILVEAGALYGRDHATSPAEAEQWQGLVDGYAANLAGDVLGLIMDMISLASLGAANTGPAQEVARIFNASGAILKQWGPNLIALLGGIWNVWGGEIVKWLGAEEASVLDAGTPTPTNGSGSPAGSSTEAAAPVNAQALADGSPIQRVLGDTPAVVRLLAEATALDAAGDIVDLNAPQARAAYDSVNAVIDLLAEYMDEKMAEIDAVVMAIGDGRTSFQLIRDAVASSIDLLNEKLTMVTELVTVAGNGEAITLQVQEYCDSAIASIDAIQMPSVQIPEVDLGDGLLADAAEGLANSAAELANEQLRALVATVASSFESAKTEMKTPIEDVRGKAEGFGEFLQNVAEVGSHQMGVISGHLATFSQGLSRCENIEEVINLIIGQISAITGVPSFTVQDLRDLWGGVGDAIDQFAALGPKLHASAGAARTRAHALARGEDVEDEDAPQAAPPVGDPVGAPV